MKNTLWKLFANWLVNSPSALDGMIGFAFRHKYLDISKKDGIPYMGRWWVMPEILLTKDENGDPHPYTWIPFIARLHHIRSKDGDRDLHDHPADYRTIILRGWYVEEDIYGVRHKRIAGQTITARAQNFHTIVEISPGGVWTLFMLGKRINDWGFLVTNSKGVSRKVRWQDYEDR